MYSAKAIIGEEIIGSCVTHDIIDAKNNLLTRPKRIKLKNSSKKRTGRLSEAYVEKEIKKIDGTQKFYETINKNKEDVSKKLKEFFNVDFEVLDKGLIKGNQLIGECTEIGKIKIIPDHASCHQGQNVPMKCKEFALCYVNLHAETTYTKL